MEFHFRRSNSSKNRCMPFSIESTRYSLVKGERIVRFVLSTWLHGLIQGSIRCFYTLILRCLGLFYSMWDRFSGVYLTGPKTYFMGRSETLLIRFGCTVLLCLVVCLTRPKSYAFTVFVCCECFCNPREMIIIQKITDNWLKSAGD